MSYIVGDVILNMRLQSVLKVTYFCVFGTLLRLRRHVKVLFCVFNFRVLRMIPVIVS
jgi:hypothetical protein